MKLMLWMVFFLLCLNIASLGVYSFLTTIGATGYYNFGIVYDQQKQDTAISEMNTSINPDQLVSTGTWINRLMDMVYLGWIIKFFKMLAGLMFGLVILLKPIFSPLLGPTLSNQIFGVLTSFITISYIYGGFVAFTGKSAK